MIGPSSSRSKPDGKRSSGRSNPRPRRSGGSRATGRVRSGGGSGAGRGGGGGGGGCGRGRFGLRFREDACGLIDDRVREGFGARQRQLIGAFEAADDRGVEQ